MIPKVSICMITYNHANYIEQAINSVLQQQTDFDYEIVIGDDCSTDGTTEIIRKIECQYPKAVRTIYRKNNIGSKANWIDTFNNCKGEYIALLEGDDYWNDRLKLQKQVNFFEINDYKKEYSLSFHDSCIIDNMGIRTCDSLLCGFKGDLVCDDILLGKTIPTQTVMFRKEFLDISVLKVLKAKNQDTFLFTLLTHKGKAKALSQIDKSVYRKHEGGIWSTLSIVTKYSESLNYQREIYSILDKKYRDLILQRIYAMSKEIHKEEITYKSYILIKLKCFNLLIERGAITLGLRVLINMMNLTLSKILLKSKRKFVFDFKLY